MYDCSDGMQNHDCAKCKVACDEAPDDVPLGSTAADYCGDIDRTDCQRFNNSCNVACGGMLECQGDEDELSIIRSEVGSKCWYCHEKCGSIYYPQCEMKRNYDLNGGIFAYDRTECLDFTKYPNIGAKTCCETLVHKAKLDECAWWVKMECDDTCYAMMEEGDWDAGDVCIQKCECYFGSIYFRGDNPEDCEAMGQSTSLFSVDLTGNPMFVMSVIIAGMLLFIAGLVCWAICIKGTRLRWEVFVDSENENLKL